LKVHILMMTIRCMGNLFKSQERIGSELNLTQNANLRKIMTSYISTETKITQNYSMNLLVEN